MGIQVLWANILWFCFWETLFMKISDAWTAFELPNSLLLMSLQFLHFVTWFSSLSIRVKRLIRVCHWNIIAPIYLANPCMHSNPITSGIIWSKLKRKPNNKRILSIYKFATRHQNLYQFSVITDWLLSNCKVCTAGLLVEADYCVNFCKFCNLISKYDTKRALARH